MARQRTIPRQLYLPGVYLPVNVDSFTNTQVDILRAAFPVDPTWPTNNPAQPLLRARVEWDTGEWVEQIWHCEPMVRPKDGSALTEIYVFCDVPVTGNGRKNVSSGKLEIEAYLPIFLEIRVEAVNQGKIAAQKS
jgi:hypothetical protein